MKWGCCTRDGRLNDRSGAGVGTLLEQSDVGTDLPNFEMSHDCRLMKLQPRPFGVWISPRAYMAVFTHRLNLKMRINA
jgi:hypothetical protein